ncbi:MAG: ankyrin repeat domain-containing protein [Chloroflexota bacterium]
MQGEEQFVEAVKAGDFDRVKALADEHPGLLGLKYQGWMAGALLALYYNEPHIAAWLAERGGLLDVFVAAAVNSLERLRRLLDDDPQLAQAVAPDGFQPLGLAAFFGAPAAAALLVERGAPVDAPSRNAMRVTPLHSAAAGGHVAICRLLLEHGADANARQADEFTPLHAAAQNGSLELIELLLAHGANLQARTAAGLTPLALAQAAGHAPAVELLRGRGAAG